MSEQDNRDYFITRMDGFNLHSPYDKDFIEFESYAEALVFYYLLKWIEADDKMEHYARKENSIGYDGVVAYGKEKYKC